ncbi:MAG TPA: hypothetical protein EYP14_08785, partial [Planctomycetaceae bacterium]|nr:hypothetical protein [Planctomycetaceae bacterium]
MPVVIDATLPGGWWLVPVRGKRPIGGNDWPRKAVLASEANGRWRGADGYGLLLGPRSGVIDIEEDGADAAICYGELVGGDPPVTPTWQSRRGKHRLFAWHPALARCKAKVDLGAGLEARIGHDRAQSVLPPAGGRRWLVRPDEVDPAPLPPPLLQAILATCNRSDGATQASADGPIPEGERNTTLTSLAGVMRRRGMSTDAILAALLAENDRRCDPPLATDEVRRIAQSVGRYAPEEDTPHFPLTDSGNAERFARQHRQDVRYCHPWRKWVVWDGQRWKIDDTAAVDRRAKSTVRSIYAEAAAADDETQRKAIAAHARHSEACARRRAMLTLAASEPG